LVKHKRGIDQSVIYTLCGVLGFVYYLFHDQGPEKKIQKSIDREIEVDIINPAWDDFNVFVSLVSAIAQVSASNIKIQRAGALKRCSSCTNHPRH